MTSDQGPGDCEFTENRGVFNILNILLEDGGDLPEPNGDGSVYANVSPSPREEAEVRHQEGELCMHSPPHPHSPRLLFCSSCDTLQFWARTKVGPGGLRQVL